MEDGLPNNTIYDVKEDKNGNILIGTDNGLSVFNGTNFRNYTVKDGLFNPYVTSLHVAKNGDVYLNCYNGMIQKFDGRKFTDTGVFFGNDLELFADEKTLFVRRPFGGALLDYKGFPTVSIHQYNLKNYKNTYNLLSNYKKEYPKILPFYFQNNQLITTKNGNAYFGNRSAVFPKTEDYFYNVIFRKNDMIYLVKNKIIRADFQSKLLQNIKIPYEITETKKYHLMLDANDDLWINFQRSGLYKLENDKLVNYSPLLSLSPNQNVDNMFSDSKGRIWISTFDKGLFLINNPKVKLMFSGKTEQNFNSFMQHPKLGLLTASRFNIYKIKNDSLTHESVIEQNEMLLSTLDSEPIISVKTGISKAGYYKNFYKNIPAIWGYNPFSYKNFTISHSKNTILVTNKKQRFHFKEKVIVNGINYALTNYIDRVQNLLPYKNGVLYNNGKKIRILDFVKEKDTLFDIHLLKTLDFKTKDFISAVAKKDEKTLLLTTGNTLYTMVNEKVTDSIKSVNTKYFGYVNKIIPRGNQIWLCAQNGLFKIDKENGSRVFNQHNLLTDNEVNDVLFLEDYLYVATKNGITKIPLEETDKMAEKPKILNFSYKTSREDEPVLKNSIEMKHDEDFLKVYMNIQNYVSPKNMIIQYRIDGSAWNNTSNSYLDFPSLSSGNHLLEIQIRNINSGWNLYQINIKKQAPFYATWWFVLIASFIPLFVIFAFLLYYFQKNEKQQKNRLETENKILELRQQALFAMMNPHFVFNALNAIQYFINSNQKEKGSEYLAKFAKLTREVLNHADKSFLTIDSEINRLKMYVELEQLRFQNFAFEIEVEPEISKESIKIPNMMIQPFIENAILHGVSPLRTNDGKIQLTFSKNDENLFIQIIDNGVGKDMNRTQSKHASKGIKMIRERFEILNKNSTVENYKISESVAFPDSERKGHKVCIEIPFEEIL